jgi:predicted phosphoribosyltransferase/dienelactone hydrolase
MVGVCRDITIPRNGVRLAGRLLFPAAPAPAPIVIFVHGLGSSKASPRNTVIAAHVLEAGIAALLFDLSGHGESSDDPRGQDAFVDDLVAAVRWAGADPRFDPARVGIAGSSLGAVVAVQAAARGGIRAATMVLRAPPLGPDDWHTLEVPSLILIGSRDPLLGEVRAGAAKRPAATLSIVEGASHLFEEPGALEEAMTRTVDWFRTRLLEAGDPPAEAPMPARTAGSYGALFRDRRDAGAQLGARLTEQYKGRDVLVLGIPRGGVPVADEIARQLNAELDVVVARKLGAPGYAELAIGAVTANGGRFLNDDVIRELAVSENYLRSVTAEQQEEAGRREKLFRQGRPPADFRGRAVIIADDGLATGATMRAAVRSVRQGNATRVVVAVPVGSEQACAALGREADEVVCLFAPEPFWAVGFYYEQFGQTEDSEVQQILSDAHVRRAPVEGRTS